MRIGVNEFAKRQTADSRFTHYDGTWEELRELVDKNFDNQKPGYRDGVLLVNVPADGFYMVGPYIEGKEYKAVFKARREGEEPFMQIENNDEKIPCGYVEIVLYRKDVLDEGEEATTDAEWEVVSINGRDNDAEEPMTPLTMARNYLGLQGGTKGNFSAEDFAKAIVYWSKRG